MAEKETKVAEETVSKAEYDRVVAERDKYLKAVNTLLDAMTRRYAQDLVKELGLDK